MKNAMSLVLDLFVIDLNFLQPECNVKSYDDAIFITEKLVAIGCEKAEVLLPVPLYIQ